MAASSPARAPSPKARALRYLSQREHSRAELERKLAAHEPDAQRVAAALDELQAKGFIDERRVAESVLHRRAPRLGGLRVAQELRAKGLPADVVVEALERLREGELQRAHEVWRKRFGVAPSDPRERVRQARFLAGRGFAPEVIQRVLKGDLDEAG